MTVLIMYLGIDNSCSFQHGYCFTYAVSGCLNALMGMGINSI